MRVTLNVPASRRYLRAALRGLQAASVEDLATGRIPPLYRAGVRYQRERRERWLRPSEVLAQGHGDCEDLASWRAAELELVGVPAVVDVMRSGKGRFHAVVLLPDGTIEDPSRRLGMGRRR